MSVFKKSIKNNYIYNNNNNFLVLNFKVRERYKIVGFYGIIKLNVKITRF